VAAPRLRTVQQRTLPFLILATAFAGTVWWQIPLPSGFPGSQDTSATTVAVADVLLAITGIAGLAAWARRDLSLALGPRALHLAAALVLLAAALGAATAPNPGLARAWTLHLLLVWLLFATIAAAPVAPWQIAAALVAGLVVQAPIALEQVLRQTTSPDWLVLAWGADFRPNLQYASVLLEHDGTRWLRAYGPFFHPNILGGYVALELVLLVAIAALLARRGTSLKGWYAGGAAVGLAAGCLALSASRSAWLGAAVGVVALAVGCHRWQVVQDCSVGWFRGRPPGIEAVGHSGDSVGAEDRPHSNTPLPWAADARRGVWLYALISPWARRLRMANSLDSGGPSPKPADPVAERPVDRQPIVPHPGTGFRYAQLGRAVAAACLVTAAILLATRPPLLERFNPNSNALEQQSVQERAFTLDMGWQLFRAHPILGVGAGNIDYAEVAFYKGQYAPIPVHSVPLLMAVELGPLGIVAWAVAAFTIVWQTWRQPCPWTIAFAGALIAAGVAGLFDHYFWSIPTAQTTLAVLAGGWAASIRRGPGGAVGTRGRPVEHGAATALQP